MIGGIHNVLENPDESLNHYNLASNDLATLPETESSSESADMKAVLDLKLAQHQLRIKNYKEAQ